MYKDFEVHAWRGRVGPGAVRPSDECCLMSDCPLEAWAAYQRACDSGEWATVILEKNNGTPYWDLLAAFGAKE